MFDRKTGEPLFPSGTRSVPPSSVEGEKLSEIQPYPLRPPPFTRQALTEDMLTKRTPEAHAAALARFRKVNSHGMFYPPTTQGTIIFPGFDGGGEWGGAAFDPASALLYVNANEMAWIMRLVPRETKDAYKSNCASCHRADRRGTPPEFPSLVDIGQRRSRAEIAAIIREGAGRMPGFASLGAETIRGLADYLLTGKEMEAAQADPNCLKYRNDGYNMFLDPDGYPAIQPPWGTLNAIDLNKGDIRWQIPFGEYPELAAKGLKNTGSDNYGGPVATAAGLLFIGATNFDQKFHVYDKPHRQAALGNGIARRRQRHSRRLRSQRPPIRRHRLRRRQKGRAHRRQHRRLRIAEVAPASLEQGWMFGPYQGMALAVPNRSRENAGL